jgi:hypothetical protein
LVEGLCRFFARRKKERRKKRSRSGLVRSSA